MNVYQHRVNEANKKGLFGKDAWSVNVGHDTGCSHYKDRKLCDCDPDIICTNLKTKEVIELDANGDAKVKAKQS